MDYQTGKQKKRVSFAPLYLSVDLPDFACKAIGAQKRLGTSFSLHAISPPALAVGPCCWAQVELVDTFWAMGVQRWSACLRGAGGTAPSAAQRPSPGKAVPGELSRRVSQ